MTMTKEPYVCFSSVVGRPGIDMLKTHDSLIIASSLNDYYILTLTQETSQQRVETRFLSSRYARSRPTLLQFCCRHRAISPRLLMFARGSKPTSHGTAPCSSQSVARQPSRPSSLGSPSLAQLHMPYQTSRCLEPHRHTLRSPAHVPTANDLQRRTRACIRLYASSVV
jgi:hypothetical protein